MLFRLCVVLCGFFSAHLMAAQCLEPARLKAIDAQYEEALRVGDIKFLDRLLADEYVWVHNLASDIETKSGLLKRLKDQEEIPKSRVSHDIHVHRLADTGVLSGLSSVDKYNPDGETFRTSRYRFLRTYVAHKGHCKLLAVQTMKVWNSDEADKSN